MDDYEALVKFTSENGSLSSSIEKHLLTIESDGVSKIFYRFVFRSSSNDEYVLEGNNSVYSFKLRSSCNTTLYDVLQEELSEQKMFYKNSNVYYDAHVLYMYWLIRLTKKNLSLV